MKNYTNHTEVSIDLTYLKKIFFDDEKLLPDVLAEWCEDIRDRLEKINQKFALPQQNLHKELHELKTSFAMVGYQQGIHYVQELLHKVENQLSLVELEVMELNNLTSKVIDKISGLN